MNVDKAWRALARLIDDGPDDVLKFAKASAILDGLEREVSTHPLAEETRRIIAETRVSFEHLCGLGGYEAGDEQFRLHLKARFSRLDIRTDKP